MSYEQLIRNWHAKASEEDYFAKFVFEYLAFIAYLKTQKYSSDDKDRVAIQKLKQDTTVKNMYLNKMNLGGDLKSDWEHIQRTLNEIRLGDASRDLNDTREIDWWNCSHEHQNQKSMEEQAQLRGVIHSLQDWGNMVEFWYSIRNNLFHGAKNPENERDQFAVKYAYKTLRPLMEIFLERNR